MDVPYCTDPHDSENVENGFRKRVANRTVLEELQLTANLSNDHGDIAEYWFELNRLGMFVKRFLEGLQPLPALSVDSFDEWLLGCDHYNESRKNQLRMAHLKYLEAGLTGYDYTCKSFIKREFYEGFKYPRLINSRSDKFKVAVGPAIKKIEEVIYKLKWFVNGCVVTKLAKLLVPLSRFKYILETDYSSFEGSFSPEYVQRVERQLWRRMLANNLDVLQVIDKSYERPNIIHSHEYTAKVEGCRMSGEMWTSLANGFSNLMNMLYLIDKYHLEADGFVEGDDAIFGLSDNVISERDFKMLGFRIKMTYGNDFSNSSFCGNVFDSVEMETVVSPENIARLQWSCNSQYLYASDVKLMGLLRAKAMSLYCIGLHTPIAGLLAYKILQIIGVDGLVLIDPSRRFWRREVLKIFRTLPFVRPVITESSRQIYASHFGVSYEQQYSCEDIIDKAKNLNELCLPYVFVSNDLDYLYY